MPETQIFMSSSTFSVIIAFFLNRPAVAFITQCALPDHLLRQVVNNAVLFSIHTLNSRQGEAGKFLCYFRSTIRPRVTKVIHADERHDKENIYIKKILCLAEDTNSKWEYNIRDQCLDQIV